MHTGFFIMHEGHRKRLLEKLKNGDNLFEHELLEILLYNAYPRVNVNPIAHNLLQRFASISEVINASMEELMLVDGVGENVAMYLKCIGECMKFKNDCQSFAVIKNNADFTRFASMRLSGKAAEVLEFYLVDRSGRVCRVCSFTDKHPSRVSVQPEDLVKIISAYHPHAIYVAHNHVDCPCEPSPSDDDMTKKIQLICSMNNVRLIDHCICGPDGIFSYFMSNRLDKIAYEYSASYFFRQKL